MRRLSDAERGQKRDLELSTLAIATERPCPKVTRPGRRSLAWCSAWPSFDQSSSRSMVCRPGLTSMVREDLSMLYLLMMDFCS